MNLLNYLIPFVLALGLLILVHELGHYLVARWCGVKVLRFSLGFGKPLLVRKAGRDQTEWALAAFPLGGYVKMLDEREAPVAAAELHRAFNRQSVYRRLAIVAAGPIANFLLAIVLYWGLFVVGSDELRPRLALSDKPAIAQAAGVRDGDLVLAVDGEAVRSLVFGVLAEYGLAPDVAGADADLLDLEASYGGRGAWFIVVTTPEGERDVLVVELFNPVYTRSFGDEGEETLTYEAIVLQSYQGEALDEWVPQADDDQLPGEFSNISLFIDDCPDAVHCYVSRYTGETKHNIPVKEYVVVGEIPGGPYGYCYSWSQWTCIPCEVEHYELVNLCNAAYPDECEGPRSVRGTCEA